ncbi:MAG: carboxypeptidase regulatory-like domain-containing protein [Anaerolineales bacterium]|nr:carboxypeptidase regulatory-like domain-containing protein [Anaerolineales bacterium]
MRKACFACSILAVAILLGIVLSRTDPSLASNDRAPLPLGFHQDVTDDTFCQLFYELQTAKEANGEAYNALSNCGEEGEAACDGFEMERYTQTKQAEAEAQQRYDAYYEAHWMNRPYAEKDQFWQWCLGLGGSSGLTESSPTLTVATPTPQVQTNPIVLKASLGGKGEATQTILNTNNYEAVTIHGVVTDQAGQGISGATIEVVSGANSASITTNPDGSYSLTVNTPGGQGSGAFQGVNFSLQLGDLSIDRIVLLQAIEGGQLVTARDVGVRVFLNWGLDEPVNVEVIITLDNQALPAVQGVAQKDFTQIDRNRGTDAINIVIPKDRFPSWGDSTHTLTAAVAVISPHIVDANLSNNVSAPHNFTLKNTAVLSILYVSLDASIGKSSLVNFAAQAHSYLNKVYPVSYSWGFVGTKQVSYYLVSPYVNFMKSLDADDLPFKLGDIGIVEGGLEAGKSFSYKAAIVAIEKARRLYNSQRCKDAQGNLILPCPDEVALQAVGVYPDGAFGSSKDGFAYVDQRNEWRAAANSQAKPNNVAHELGHLFGFGEEYSPTTIGVPVTGSTWDGVKFRTADGSCINIMGNVGLACSWINPQTWNSLLEDALKLNSPSSISVASLDWRAPRFEPLIAEVQSPAIVVEGVVTSAGEGFLERVTTVDRYLQAEVLGGQFKLEARDASGNSLGAVQFDGLFFDLETNPVSVSPFLVLLPVADPAQVAEIVFSTPGGQTVDTMRRSASAPQVSFDPLPAEIQDQATITWQASDADGDSLLSTLYSSKDGGLSWQLLGVDMPVNSYSLDVKELPGGSTVFKVSVSDGFNTAESVSSLVSMPDQPPVITIIQPWGVEFDGQEMVSLEAVAYDLEDGLLSANAIQWFDAQGNLLGAGTLLQTAAPGAGTNRITAKAQDSSGQLSEAGVDITITGALPETSSPAPLLPAPLLPGNALYLLGSGMCGLLLLGGLLIGGVFLLARGRRQPGMAGTARQGRPVQDGQGNWWSQEPQTGAWYFWNGRTWQPTPGGATRAAPPRRSGTSCLLAFVTSGLIALVVVGGISLAAFHFFPAYQIPIGQGDVIQILKMGGGGLLVAVLGLLLLNGGFKAILTRRAIVTDERGRRREKSGCSAILNGFGQLLIGVVCLAGGLGLMTLVFYQEILPWLGFY